MRQTIDGKFELDDDKTRVDLDAVHDYLANESYWAKGRARDIQERLIDEAARVVGLYDGDRQIGFARASSDGAAYVYLADVYVLPEFRGRGLGQALVREMIEGSPLSRLKWILHTRDAHDLYRKFGFDTPNVRVMERARRD
jgi:GNAT superfamily N-acetyltransferase